MPLPLPNQPLTHITHSSQTSYQFNEGVFAPQPADINNSSGNLNS